MNICKSKIMFFVACVLFNVTQSKHHNKRHAKTLNPPNDYHGKYPYQPMPAYQSPYYQPQFSAPYGYPPPPVGMPPMYSPYQNPYYVNYQYPPYMPMYPPYPLYYPYPYYQPYPYQPHAPNFPDPFAHIPTEIVDVDSDDTIESDKPKFEIDSSQQVSASGLSQQSIKSSKVVTTKPIQTVITRTFNTNSKPIVSIQQSNLQPGSDTIIDVKSEDDKNDKESDKETNEKKDGEEKSLFSLLG